MTKVVERYDLTIIERRGSTSWDGNSFRTWLFFGHYWLHVNKKFRWPLISFMILPF